ncbi:hypothetical protein BLEM_1276 [Bifidobacterium lemurum]|uniref:Uncharacterized protein n=1 Tax=Bifidobacterium lemurum TaxID=1603886 RepID=A0A261FS41_9BIFI|nr:hypothetical protein [Bifidobacterium lemurum]OZG61967.1 hypothetical protein BLEM_1276 [Bifidobacterium lemurum]QOL35255.1 hypothetical protein BL8807_05240 [Bifidobacterium lemurum]
MGLVSLLFDPHTTAWLLAVSVVCITQFHAQIWLVPVRVSFMPVQCALLTVFLALDPTVLSALASAPFGRWPSAARFLVMLVRYALLPALMLVVVPYRWYRVEPRVRGFTIVRNLIIVAVSALLTFGAVQAKALLYGPDAPLAGGADIVAVAVIAAGTLMLLDTLFVQRVRVAILARAQSADQDHDPFLMFSAVQLAVLCFTLMMAVTIFRDATAFTIAADVLALVCLVTDMAVSASMSREMEAREHQARNALLEERLDAQLEEYAAIAHHVKAAAQRRHDLRNQLGAVEILARRGDFASAARHMDALRRDWLAEDGALRDGEAHG